jgi:hypothetical protein
MIKRRFARTNKRRYTSQLAAAEVHERLMRHIAQRLAAHARLSQTGAHRTRRQKQAHIQRGGDEGEGSLGTTTRYVMADVSKEKKNVLEWVHTNHTDVAMKVWHTKYRRAY